MTTGFISLPLAETLSATKTWRSPGDGAAEPRAITLHVLAKNRRHRRGSSFAFVSRANSLQGRMHVQKETTMTVRPAVMGVASVLMMATAAMAQSDVRGPGLDAGSWRVRATGAPRTIRAPPSRR